MVRAATTGMKEADMSFVTVLNNLFLPMTRKRAKELGLTEAEEGRYVNRLSREVEATGALDKVALGTIHLFAYMFFWILTFRSPQDASNTTPTSDDMTPTSHDTRKLKNGSRLTTC